MKKIFKIFISGLFLFLTSIGFSQLAMNLSMENSSYIRYEKISAILTIKNQSGIPIVFGDSKDLSAKIKITLQRISGEYPQSINTKNLTIKNVIIKPGEKDEFSIPISEYYAFKGEGRYKVKAVVSHPQLKNSFQTNYVEFSVVKYDTIWQTTVGVPEVLANDKDKISSIKYSIISYFDGYHKIYCLLVEDNDFIYSVNRLGLNIGTGKPEVEIDKLSKIHILIQNGTNIYTYFIYNTNGKLETKEIYKASESSKIRISTNAISGRMEVIGGVKAQSGTDYEATSPKTSTGGTTQK